MPQDDWSTQLKKIEREFEGLPPEPSPAFKKLQSEEQRRAQERAQQRAGMIGGGARLVLVAALGVALAFWPYENTCGSGLFGYLAVEAVIVIGGLWVAITTWRARLPKMHILSLLIALTGLVLLAMEILPRVGYAAVDPKHPPAFSCPETGTASPRVTAAEPPATAAEPRVAAAEPLGTAAESRLVGVESRVNLATGMFHERWKSTTEELANKLRPQREALAKLERPELLSQPSHGSPRD